MAMANFTPVLPMLTMMRRVTYNSMIQETINIMVMIICRILIAAPTLKITVKQKTAKTSDNLLMEIITN